MERSAFLSKLLPFPKDRYLTAFGPDGRSFLGSSNGYTATSLPTKLVDALIAKSAKRVTFVSFGSHIDSWFVFIEGPDGPDCLFSKALPRTLQNAVRGFMTDSPDRLKFLRVQCGPGNSYTVWNHSKWACNDIPDSLHKFLKDMSLPQKATANSGTWRGGHPTQIAWHPDGSYFVLGRMGQCEDIEVDPKYHMWEFKSDTINVGLRKLFQTPQDGEPYYNEVAKLVHVAIDPYTPTCNQFVFILKADDGKEADFAFQVDGNELVTRHAFVKNKLKPVPQNPCKFQWAHSLHNGRPHPLDNYELPMRKNERVKVLEDKGNDWRLVENTLGRQGYAHMKWLDLKRTASDAYQEFVEDVMTKFKLGKITAFPDMRLYVTDRCREEHCKTVKDDDLQICAHELEQLLRGSGCYSYAFLKEERNKWHPDKFARHCHGSHRDALKEKSQQLFVLMGLLMDLLRVEDDDD